MKIEYISQTVLRRSILKPLQERSKELLLPLSEAEMCSAIHVDRTKEVVFTSATVTGNAKEIGIYAIARVVNDLATRGAETVGVSIIVMLPPHAYESRLKAMIQHMEDMCESLNVQITHADADITPALTQAVVSVTGMGTIKDAILQGRLAKPKQEIILVGSVGLEGVLRIVSEKEEELRERFVGTFIQQIQSTKSELVKLRAIEIAKTNGVVAMQQIGKGGIMAGLWEIAEAANLGLSISLPDITIKQETVEVCEFYHLNPYQLTSAGTILMYTDEGEALISALAAAGIYASKIGSTTDLKERVITGGAEIRYMDRPQPDELNKIWG